ncbi:MAG: 30S ribosomal protein S6 [Bacteroidales bacterium]|nr:30S ribosomal protein S6 [Bacteroidales bacterium]MCF8388220.1 30S ribosomal protein S6 [Bacteroidales bacterium]MCF8396665.1 30S ribosomal protein S6 [Bacteroidales bacterium]
MNQYETVFILTPVLSEEQMKEAVNKYRGFLKDKGAEMVHEENWGMRKFAYPIQKKSTGFYHLFEYKAEGKAIDTLEVELIRDERIMRFLTVKLDKHAIAYNEKKRRKAKEAKAEPKEEETSNEPQKS